MLTNNCKKLSVLSTLFIGSLVIESVAIAEEKMIAVPDLTFGLQTKVQSVLTKQIDYESSVTSAQHIAQQDFDQILIDTANANYEEKDSGASLAVNLPRKQIVEKVQQLKAD